MSDSNELFGPVKPDKEKRVSAQETDNEHILPPEHARGNASPNAPRGAIVSKRVVIPRSARRKSAAPPNGEPEQTGEQPSKPIEPSVPPELPVARAQAPAPPLTPDEFPAPPVRTPGPELSTESQPPSENAAPSPAEPIETPPEPSFPPFESRPSDPVLVLAEQQIGTICPFLGLTTDRSSRFSAPSPAHRCYSPKRPGNVTVEYQVEFCFSTNYPSCVRYQAPVSEVQVAGAAPQTRVAGKTAPAILPVSEVAVPATAKRGGRAIELILWVIALVVLVGAIIAVVPILIPGGFSGLLAGIASQSTNQPSPTSEVAIVLNAPTPTATETVLPTEAPTFTPIPPLAPLVIPTPPEGGQSLTLLPRGALTGWAADKELQPHWGDARLIAGSLQDRQFASILQFDLANLPSGSRVLFAALELTGREAGQLAPDAQWQIDIVEPLTPDDWVAKSSEEVLNVPTLGTLQQPLLASEVGPRVVNRVLFSETDRQLLEQQFASGRLALRIRGPQSGKDNLFTWEAGGATSSLDAPQLHLVVIPGEYVVVTNTPVPTNVLTAAAYVVRGTDFARRNGTPTPFPPGVATATPGGEQVIIEASTAIPDNSATAAARARIATAVALTTGTYTPTPVGVVIIFPTLTPVVITQNLATATPIPPDVDLLTIPIDYESCRCQGKILLLSNRFGGSQGSPIMLEPDGTELGKLSGDLYYRLALAREQYSPDRTKRIIYPVDERGIQQIGIEDINTREITILTKFTKGLAYDAAWAPDGSAIVFVATDVDNADQIYLYDFGTGQVKLLVETPGGQPWFKHPTWSPDSQQIAYWSSLSGNAQIWVMNRDGTNQHNISNNGFDERDPVWVK